MEKRLRIALSVVCNGCASHVDTFNQPRQEQTVRQLPAAEVTVILRLPKVIALVGLSRSTLYNKVAAREFPQPIRISERAIGFVESEVREWIGERIRLSRDSPPKLAA